MIDSASSVAADAGGPSKQYRLGFRPDIEGLRAIAILLVVAAHAHVSWLAGGFVGVDVFFVLSGYLITALLLQEVRISGRVCLIAFYARRLQRLLPALLLTVICTAIAAAILLAPFEQLPQASAALAATTWTSNLYFALSHLDYFGPAAADNLFLHTWSLGVEEQFYLLWPALILFLLGAWRWQGRGQDFTRLAKGMAATVVLCLALSLLLTQTTPALAFYTVISRAWQFALGALVVLAGAGPSHTAANAWLSRLKLIPDRHPAVNMLLGWSGLAMIFAAAVLIDASTPYPGVASLLPSIGTAAVLAAGAANARGATRMLALRPFQYIGRNSYAWYLWHWPTLLLGATVLDTKQPHNLAILVLFSFVLAMLSSRWIESPLRRARVLRARPGWVIVASLVLMAATCTAVIGWKHEASRWAQHQAQVRYTKIKFDIPVIYEMGCDDWYTSARIRACFFGDEHATHTVVLLGDSVAGQWFPVVENHFTRPDWRILVLTKSACPMVDKTIFYERIGRAYIECTQWRNAVLNYLRKIQPDLILMGSTSTYSLSPEEWQQGSARILSALAPAAKRIGVLMPTPTLPFDGPGCLARKHWRGRFWGQTDACSAVAGNAHLDAIRQALKLAVATVPNAHVLDMDDAVCPHGRCMAERNGVIVYRDSQHVAMGYMTTLDVAFGKALKNAKLD